MQSYIRRLGESFDGLRALMKSALPLLIRVSASKAVLVIRVWESRSNLSVSSSRVYSHRTVGDLNFLVCSSYVISVKLLPDQSL